MVSWKAFMRAVLHLNPIDHARKAEGRFVDDCGAISTEVEKVGGKGAIEKPNDQCNKKGGKNQLGHLPFFKFFRGPLNTKEEKEEHDEVVDIVHDPMTGKGPKVLPKRAFMDPSIKEVKGLLVEEVPKGAGVGAQPTDPNKTDNKERDEQFLHDFIS